MLAGHAHPPIEAQTVQVVPAALVVLTEKSCFQTHCTLAPAAGREEAMAVPRPQADWIPLRVLQRYREGSVAGHWQLESGWV